MEFGVDLYHDKMRTGGSLLLRGAAAACLGLLLAACGDGPKQEAGPPPEPHVEEAAAVVENDPRPVLVAFGDSLTAGIRIRSHETYPSYLQREFDERGMEFRVVNEGVSGDTTARGLSRVSTALSHDPEWVILALGANDGLRGLAIDVMEENLDRMIEEFQSRGTKVVLAGMMLPRNYGPEYVDSFESVFPRLAEKREVPLIPFLLENVAMDPDLNQSDGIHPNARGNEIIARQVADALQELLQSEI